jgi:hypothetical protein
MLILLANTQAANAGEVVAKSIFLVDEEDHIVAANTVTGQFFRLTIHAKETLVGPYFYLTIPLLFYLVSLVLALAARKSKNPAIIQT